MDDYDKWRQRLLGDFLPIDPSVPEPGCYRIRRGDLSGWDAVQIWTSIDHNGEFIFYATRNEVACPWRLVWPKCAERPVSSTAFKRFRDTGHWPDEVKAEEMPEGGNFAEAPEHEKMLAAVTALESEAIGWFELNGSKISNQALADKAANYAEQFLRWEQRADERRKAILKPILAQEKTIRTQWGPIETKARDAKVSIKQNWLRPYLLDQERKQKEALLDKARDPETIIAGPKAGSGGRSASVRMNWRAEVVDYRHFLAWLLSFENISEHLKSAADKIANEMVHARVKDMPGVKEIEEPVVI